MNPKKYLKILFTFLMFIGVLAAGYVYDFSQKYPPPITSRISFDAKLKFVRESIDTKKIDTLIVGSSIGLNNVLGSVLEESSLKVKHALNLSVYEATTLQVEQIVELSSAFPNLKRIIYSAQYSDFPHARTYENYNAELLRDFMTNELSPVKLSKLLFDACNNLEFCKKREEKWKKEHMQSDKFSSLLFDHTGSVPLEIYLQKGIGGRWWLAHPGIMHPKSFEAVERMVNKAHSQNIEFYLVHQPYRTGLFNEHKNVRDAVAYFDTRVESVMSKTGGKLLALQKLNLKDELFADRTHLNKNGAEIVSRVIGEFIDENEK